MAESATVNSELQRGQQEDQQSQQTASMASMYGGMGAFGGYGGAYGGMGDTAPGYGGGVMPARDNGFTQYWAHHLAAGDVRTGRLTQGPYAGMFVAPAQEKARGDWAGLTPEQRQPYYQREFNQDEADPSNPGSFFSKAQQDQVAPGFDKDFAALQSRTGAGGATGPGRAYVVTRDAQGNLTPVDPDRNVNPGSLGSSGPLANNDTRPHYTMDADNRNAGGTPQRDAIAQGQRYTQVGLGSIPNVQQPASGVVPHPMYDGSGSLQTMGQSSDVARYGPAITNQTAPTYIGQIAGRNGSTVPQIGNAPQLPRFDAQGTLVTAPPQQPRFDSRGTLISPSDTMAANGAVSDPRVGGQRPNYTVPMPAPAMAGVR